MGVIIYYYLINIFFSYYFFLITPQNIIRPKRTFPFSRLSFLSALEKQNRHLAQIKVDEMFSFVRHVRTEIASNDTMPSRIVFLIEFLFDIRRDILFDVIFF